MASSRSVAPRSGWNCSCTPAISSGPGTCPGSRRSARCTAGRCRGPGRTLGQRVAGRIERSAGAGVAGDGGRPVLGDDGRRRAAMSSSASSHVVDTSSRRADQRHVEAIGDRGGTRAGPALRARVPLRPRIVGIAVMRTTRSPSSSTMVPQPTAQMRHAEAPARSWGVPTSPALQDSEPGAASRWLDRCLEVPTWTRRRTSSADTGSAPKMKRKEYEAELRRLHGELVAMQEWVKATGAKICVVFEGRDTAGKGGSIKAITERVSPRVFRVVALPHPDRARAVADVHPALHPAPACRGRSRHLRPQLVQPRRRRTRHGLLHRRAGRAVPRDGSAVEQAMVDSGIIW